MTSLSKEPKPIANHNPSRGHIQRLFMNILPHFSQKPQRFSPARLHNRRCFSVIILLAWVPFFVYGQCPTIQAIMVDACGSEAPNEFVIINSGGGFNVSDLQLSFDTNNNNFGPENNDINIDMGNFSGDPTPCGLQSGNPAMATGCPNIIPVGPGTNIPAGALVILQTSSNADFAYDFSGVCGAGQCAYLIRNTCPRTSGGFTNSTGSGTRTSVLLVNGTPCSNSYIYNTSSLSGSDGDYFITPATFGNAACSPPPVTGGTPPPDINPLTDVSQCTPYLLPTITGTNLTGSEAYYTMSGGTGTQFLPGSTISSSTTLFIFDGTAPCSDEESFNITINTPPTANPAGPLSQCDNGSGQATFNLTSLNSTINPGLVTISWYTNMAATIPIPGPTTFTSGPTTVYATVDDGSCTSSPVAVTLTVLSGPTANDAALQACDQGGGQATFDLTSVNNTVNGGTGFTVNWYSDPAATTPIGTPGAFTSGAGFAYATVFDGTCTSANIAQITLTVNPQPSAFTASVPACDEGGGTGTFDLTSVNNTVNGGTGNTVNWFTDALAMIPIGNPASFTSAATTVYATVDNGTCTSAPVPVTLSITPPPTASPASLSACDMGGGQATFDLTDANNMVSGGAGTVTYYLDAGATMPVAMPMSFTTTSTTVFATVTVGSCTSSPVSVTLTVNTLPTANPASIQECAPGAQATFDLTSVDNTVNGGTGLNVNWYTDAGGMSPIATPASFLSGSTTVFATVDNGTCESPPTAVTLTVAQEPTAVNQTVSACDEGGMMATFNLTALIPAITGGEPSTVDFFEDINATNPINNPGNFTSITATVYAFVTGSNGCPGGPALIDLIIDPLPSAFTTSLMECDEGGLTATFNLIAENNIVNGGSGNTVIWYLDAAGTTPIATPGAFNSMTTTVFAAVDDGTCEGSTVPVQLTVQETPTAISTTLTACDEGGGQGTFDLTIAEIIINDGTANPVSWFQDAGLTIPINMPSAYVSGTGTVFAVVTAGGCSSPPVAIDLTVEAGNFANPAALDLCDQGGNMATFDLTTLNLTVNGNTGNPVNWYFDAGATSPINTPNAFTSGPTTVFATVVNGSCESATAMVTLGVLPAPSAFSTMLSACGESGGTALFDLTSVNNIVNGNTGNPVSWFFDPGGSVPINTPANFSSGVATVYARVSGGTCESPIVPVNLMIDPTPSAFSTQITACDEGNDQATFNLTNENLTVNGGTANQVNWYLDDQGLIEITNPNAFVSPSNTVYASVTDGTCTSIFVPVTLTVNSSFQASSAVLNACDEGGNQATFDLTDAETTVNNNTGLGVSWYQDPNGTVPVVNITNLMTSSTSVYATVTDGTCESEPVEVQLIVSPLPTANPASLSGCDDGTGQLLFDLTQANATVNGGTGVAVNWYTDPAGTTPINSPDQFTTPSTSVYAATDNGVCESALIEVIIAVNSTPEVTASVATPISCAGLDDGAIELDINGGTGPFTFDWNQNDFDGIEDPTNVESGNYEVTVTDVNGCMDIATVSLDEPSPLEIECSIRNPILSENGNEGEIGLEFTGGVPPYNIEWMGPVSGSQVENTPGMITITGLTAGDYTITITDDLGCQQTCTLTIEPFACILSLSISAQAGDCGTMGNGSIDLTINNGTGPYVIDWDDDALDGQEDPTGLDSGQYGVTVTDANNCVDSTTVFVGQGVPLSLSCDELNPISAAGLSDGQAEIAFGGGMNPYTIAWSGPTSGSQMENNVGVYVINDLAAGNYTITITDSDGCTIECEFIINEADCELDVTFETTDITCPGNADGTIALTITGTTPITIDWDEDIYDGMENLSNLSAGLYLVQVTAADGCNDNLAIPINQPGEILVSCSVTSTVTTPGGADGTASISLMGGTGPYTISWDGPESGTQMATDPGAISLSNLSAGDYTVNLVDANNCMGSCSFTMNEPPCGIFLEIFGQNPPCDPVDFGFIDLTISGGIGPLTIDWDDDTYDGMEDLFGVGAGTYTVTVSDTTGCEATTSITLSLPPGVEVECGEFNPASLGGSDGQAEITFAGGTGPYSIFWLGPVIGNRTEETGGTIIISDLPAGMYDIIISDANFCETTCTFNITETNCSFAVVDTIQSVSCFGEDDGVIDLTVNGSNPPFTFDWDDDSFDGMEDISGLSAGEYNVTIEDSANCTEDFTFIVTQPDTLELACDQFSPISMVGAADGEASITFSGGTPPYEVEWAGSVSGNQTESMAGTIFLSNLGAGVYDVTLTDSNMCVVTCIFTITEPICDLFLEIDEEDISCNGASDGSIELEVNGGSEPYTIDWNVDALDGLQEAMGLDAGNYSVTVTDDLGCVDSISITLEEPAILELVCDEFSPVSMIGGNDGIATIELIGGTGPYTLDIDGPATVTLMQDDPGTYQVSNLPAGDYMVTLTDDNGCTTTCNFTITEPGCPMTLDIAGTDLTCNGAGDGAIDLTINNGVLPFTINWNVDQLDGQADHTDLDAGTYSVTVMDGQGCADSISVEITQPTALDVTCSEASPVSTSGGNDGEASITFSGGTPPYEISWNGPVSGNQTENVAGTVNIGNLEAGSYLLTLVDANGCQIDCSFTITDPDCMLNLMLSGTDTTCPGASDGSIDLTIINASGATDINWSNDSFDGIEDPTGLGADSYSVTVTDALGCIATGSVVINDGNQIPEVTVSAGGVVCLGDCYVFDINFTGQAPYVLEYEVVATNGSPIPLTLNSNSDAATISICPAVFGLDVGTLDVNFLNLTDAICQTTLTQSEELELVGASTNTITSTLCPEESLIVNGVTYDMNNPTGTETIVDGNQFGCDSIVEIDLTFFAPATGSFTPELCEGESITFNGTVYDELNSAGMEILTGASVNGCDSIVDVSVSFLPAATSTFSTTICDSENIIFNGTTYDQSNPTGTEILTGASVFGCDSIVEVSLDFFEPAVSDFTPELCDGESIVFNGTTYDQSNPMGTEILTGASVNGCDSTVNISVSFLPPAMGTFTPTLCEGENIVFNGTAYDQSNPSGTEILTGASVFGCDSIVEVTLDFFEPAVSDFAPELCDGESIVFNGTVYDQNNPTGTEVLNGASVNGCDSTVNITISFLEPAMGSFNPTLCEGESITFNGTIYDQDNLTGTETLPGASINGCDSIVEVTLSFFEPAVNDISPELCDGESITINGTVYDQDNPSGSTTLPGASVNGCDSTVNVFVTFLEPAVGSFSQTICEGESITVNGTVYDENNQSGTEVLPGASVIGCDSTVNVSISFFPAATGTFNQTICEGASITINGTVYDENNQSGTEVLPGASVNGCDSTVNVSISFFPAATGTFNQTICEGASITINGTVYDENNQSGTEVLPGASVNGCDSTVNVSINFFPAATGTFNQTICESASITINGTVYDENNQSGTEVLPGASVNGCDSTFNVSISFFPAATGTFNPTICEGSSITFNGTIYDQNNLSGTEVLPGASINGCDSTVTVTVNLINSVSSVIDSTLCAGASLQVNGQTYDENNPTGTETIAGGSALGCDSIITINLQFLDAIVTTVDDLLCFGESLTINGTEYNEANPTGTEVFMAANGCDSTVQVDLSFNPEITATMINNAAICAGDSTTITFELGGAATYEVAYYTTDMNTPTILSDIVDGHTINVSPAVTTTYNILYVQGTSNVGLLCQTDVGQGVTVEVSDLAVDAVVTSDYNGFDVSCTGAEDGSAMVETAGGIAPFTYAWSNGANTQEVFDLAPGAYTATVTDASGCSAEMVVEIADSPGITIETSALSPDCFDETAGSLIIENLNGGIGPFEYSLDGEFFRTVPADLPFTVAGVAPGNYVLQVQDVNDCQGELSVNVPEAEELTVTLGDNETIQLGDSIRLIPDANFDIGEVKWSPATDLSSPELPETVARPFETTTYQLTAFDSLGCSASTSITIVVQKDDRVYLPNVFSPNGDGDNDLFMIFSDNDVAEVTQFKIFDRWGNLLFDEGPFIPNDPQFGWDGTFQGQEMNSGVYVFFAEVEFVDGRTEYFEGDVLLMR